MAEPASSQSGVSTGNTVQLTPEQQLLQQQQRAQLLAQQQQRVQQQRLQQQQQLLGQNQNQQQQQQLLMMQQQNRQPGISAAPSINSQAEARQLQQLVQIQRLLQQPSLTQQQRATLQQQYRVLKQKQLSQQELKRRQQQQLGALSASTPGSLTPQQQAVLSHHQLQRQMVAGQPPSSQATPQQLQQRQAQLAAQTATQTMGVSAPSSGTPTSVQMQKHQQRLMQQQVVKQIQAQYPHLSAEQIQQMLIKRAQQRKEQMLRQQQQQQQQQQNQLRPNLQQPALTQRNQPISAQKRLALTKLRNVVETKKAEAAKLKGKFSKLKVIQQKMKSDEAYRKSAESRMSLEQLEHRLQATEDEVTKLDAEITQGTQQLTAFQNALAQQAPAAQTYQSRPASAKKQKAKPKVAVIAAKAVSGALRNAVAVANAPAPILNVPKDPPAKQKKRSGAEVKRINTIKRKCIKAKDEDHMQLVNPNITPFRNEADMIKRVSAFHVYYEDSMAKTADPGDKRFEEICKGLTDRAKALQHKYRFLMLKEATRVDSASFGVMIDKQWLQHEKIQMQKEQLAREAREKEAQRALEAQQMREEQVKALSAPIIEQPKPPMSFGNSAPSTAFALEELVGIIDMDL